jgi:hypothetical protein
LETIPGLYRLAPPGENCPLRIGFVSHGRLYGGTDRKRLTASPNSPSFPSLALFHTLLRPPDRSLQIGFVLRSLVAAPQGISSDALSCTLAGKLALFDAYDKSPEVRFRPVFLGQYQGSGRLNRTFVVRVKQSQSQRTRRGRASAQNVDWGGSLW